MRHCPSAHKQKRRHFHAKTTSAKLYIYIVVGARDLHIDEAHMALDIFRFAVFFGEKKKTHFKAAFGAQSIITDICKE